MSDLNKLPQVPDSCLPPGVTDKRGIDAFRIRYDTAKNETVPTAQLKQVPNADEAKYPDKSGTYTKGLKQVSPGVVAPNAFKAFRAALGTSNGQSIGTADFEIAQLYSGVARQNGPLGAFAATLVGGDSQNFGASIVPAAPEVASKEYATELVELYWASLLRDVPFTEYDSNPMAIAAADELTQLIKFYAGRLAKNKVTPNTLFRGGFNGTRSNWFAGEDVGPYISQFCIQGTFLGTQELNQKMFTYVSGLDYMTDLTAWFLVQNGKLPKAKNVEDPQRRFMHNGRALCAFTHVDELYQAYLTAYLVLKTLDIKMNPTNPYTKYKNQKPFGTFGGPDIAATLGAVSRAAINAVWYQKWIIHLRHRPESAGGLVHLVHNPAVGRTDAQSDINPLILNSKALKESNDQNGSFLLSQAFPEGSPTHPAYPTGHGTVAGACITVLKFFFDGDASFPKDKALVPTRDGLACEPYTGADAPKMTVNGELHKLAHNISFGHGIHAGIHWRSDTDYSILLGEEVAIRFLEDQQWTYKEDFRVTLKKIDRSTYTFNNQ